MDRKKKGGQTPPEKWSFREKYVRDLCQKRMKKLKPTLFHYLDKWALEKPNEIAMVEYNTGEEITWANFQQASKAFAARLLEYGLDKGDVIATSLPLLKEHIYLMVGCMRIGVIFAPLDLRLQVREINECFEKIKPKMYFFLGLTPVKDFRPMIKEVMKVHCEKQAENGSVQEWIQFQKKPEGVIKGAMHAKDFARRISCTYLWNYFKEFFGYGVFGYEKNVKTDDGAAIIFTTGSTGAAKPAVLHHEGMMLQDVATEIGFIYPATKMLEEEAKKEKRKPRIFTTLCNLPPSHIAGLQLPFVALMTGTKSVVLHIFDAAKSMDAIDKYKVNGMAQIPACYNIQWALEDYDKYDTSSIKMALYAGQSVDRQFLVNLEKMGLPGSSLALTELSGCVSFTPFNCGLEEVHQGIGYSSPCCRICIRKPMNEDGTPGEELPNGEVGEICCEGKQVFKGYYNLPEINQKCLCEDENGTRIYYTGDMGTYDDKGLHFRSRRKFIIKPKGFQVFPSEVENILMETFKDEMKHICAVGVKHKMYSQGIVAVIKFHEGKNVDVEEMEKVAKKELASYKRPSLYVILEDEFPLNRTRKRDYLAATKIAEDHVNQLKENGGWDE